MKAIVQTKIVASDAIWAKEIKFLGIPIYYRKDINAESHSKIGYHYKDEPIELIKEKRDGYGKEED